jgi:hypothetical protein
MRQVEDWEFLFAQLTSCVINFSQRSPKEPVQVKDLMPSQMRKREPEMNVQHIKRRRRAVIAEEASRVMTHFMNM